MVVKGVYLVVAHVPLEALIDQDGAESDLFGELERGGLVSGGVTRRLACEGSVVVAIDDADGHTMYEGRATRDATAAQRREIMRRDRHCRFPGCTHVVFHQPHHMDEWERERRPDQSRQPAGAVQLPPRPGALQRLVGQR